MKLLASMNSENLIAGLVGLLVGAAILYIIRELILWYWKINKIVENQDKTNALLEHQVELLKKIAAGPTLGGIAEFQHQSSLRDAHEIEKMQQPGRTDVPNKDALV